MGSVLFTLYCVVSFGGPEWSAPAGDITAAWYLEPLSGIELGFMPLEELRFASGFGTHRVRAHDHVTWHHSQSVRREDQSPALAS